MNYSKRPVFLVVLLSGLALLLAGCSTSSRAPGYSGAYRVALNEFDDAAAPVADDAIARFLAVYSGLTAEDLPERVSAAYAESLYFSDTLHVIHDRDSLETYLLKTGERLDDIRVEVLSVSQDGADVYVRWIMTTAFSVGGRDIEAESLGITHLRFDDAGKVILHQDFWDSTEGLFSHLPFVGAVVRWARSKT